jgi:uncharacterized protein
MFRLKGPAFAGLFFVLNLFSGVGYPAPGPKLSTSGQQYFRAFLEAFTPLVLKREKKGGNPRWGSKNRDCAGLVRYLFWEALQTHREDFLDMYSAVRALRRPVAAEFSAIEADWSRDNFTASQLIDRSTFVSRSPHRLRLKTGDLLYFQSPELKIRHVMLVVRAGSETYLVYHTGDARNELRIRTFSDIASLPESEWHPEASNPVFQGIYRPLFLD